MVTADQLLEQIKRDLEKEFPHEQYPSRYISLPDRELAALIVKFIYAYGKEV